MSQNPEVQYRKVPNPLAQSVTTKDGMVQHTQLDWFQRVQDSAAASQRVKVQILCLQVSVPDPVAAREVNPLLADRAIVACVHDLQGPVTVGGVLTFSPAPEGAEPSHGDYLGKAEHDLLLAAVGHDDDGERSSPQWAAQGIAAAKEFLRHGPPNKGVRQFDGSPLMFLAGAVDLARSYGASVAQCREIDPAVVFPRRSMLAPLGKADALDAAIAQQKADAERVTKETTKAITERARVNERNLEALGLEAVRVPNPITNPWQPVAPQIACAPSWFLADLDLAFAWKLPPGLPRLPHLLDFAGCRVIPTAFVVPAPAHDVEATPYPKAETFELLRALHERFGTTDRGPISPDRWTKDGITAAEAFVEEWAHVLRVIPIERTYLARLAVETTVRSFLLRPDIAGAVWWSELTRMHNAEHGVITKPRARRAINVNRPHDPGEQFHAIQKSKLGVETLAVTPPPYTGPVGREQIFEWAAAAAEGGMCPPGGMLPAKDTKPAKGRKEK